MASFLIPFLYFQTEICVHQLDKRVATFYQLDTNYFLQSVQESFTSCQ